MSLLDGDVGAALVKYITLDDDPKLLVKTGEALLYGYHFKNTTAAAAYVQLFDAAAITDVTVGTTVPNLSLGLAASAQETLGLVKPIKFALGIVAAATTTATGATGAAVDVNIFYA